ncbi:NAD(P)H-binding protein [Bombilactobacillus bombi]|uniref:NAD(P)H-binding protein n=1 Tax=Bombilactobacillus bombi TaxID=1303590 RepID=UPI0015E60D6B|nr:NAD(P)H-binding protein [Bombilactobacillus bombi]
MRNTIVRPAALTNKNPTGKIALATNLDLINHGQVRTITRSDVAQTIVECLDQQATLIRLLILVMVIYQLTKL